MKCPTCNDKGYVVSADAWNLTLQEFEKCPNCSPSTDELDDKPRSLVTLLI